MANTKDFLAIGEQRDGVWHRYKNTYMVRVMVDGRRKFVNAGNDYQAAKLLAQETKQKKAQERLTGHNKLVGNLLRRKATLTVGQMVNRYIETRRPMRKPLTIRFYEGIVGHLDAISSKEIDALNIEKITDYVSGLQHEKLSAKTINHVLTLARAACNFGVKENLIETNPFNKIENLRVAKHEPNPFSKEELNKIFSHLDQHLLPYFLLQAATGIRTGELMSLKWKDIDWHRGQLCVTKSRWGKIEDSTKTKGSEREVFLPNYIRPVLKDLQKKRKAKGDSYIVVNRSGKPYQIYLHKFWQAALKKAKVPYRPNYVLRSTFASLALQDGIDIGYISKAMGHTSIKITADKYMRYMKDANKHNEAKLSKMLEMSR